MSKELDLLLWEIEKNGDRITTNELAKLPVLQYQRALGQLRARLAQKKIILTFAEKIEGQPGNNMYRIIRPVPQQPEFFPQSKDQHGNSFYG